MAGDTTSMQTRMLNKVYYAIWPEPSATPLIITAVRADEVIE
jgi:hypothetical protein